jgi:hypothetical protein
MINWNKARSRLIRLMSGAQRHCKRTLIVLLAGLALINAGPVAAEVIQQGPYAYHVIERYKTSAEAQAACYAFASLHSYSPTAYCHSAGSGYDGWYLWEAGWLRDDGPNGTSKESWLGDYYFCQANERYFEDVKRCVLLVRVPPPTSPRENGPQCSPQAPQPSCGQPINPANGNMWHIENDYVAAAPSQLSISRTYGYDPEASQSSGYLC